MNYTPKQKIEDIVEEELTDCEKCGTELSTILIGDESGKQCRNCGLIDMR